MVKNLDRLNGVVLGTIVGQLVYCAVGYCTWWGYLGICISLFVWVTGTLYMYYNSAKYGVVGCLLAAFGSAAFLQGCTDDFAKPAKSYYAIVECVAAIFIVIGVDAIISNSRSSDLAYAAYLDFWQTVRGAVEGILNPNLHTQKSDHALLMAKVALCKMLNPPSCSSRIGNWRPVPHSSRTPCTPAPPPRAGSPAAASDRWPPPPLARAESGPAPAEQPAALRELPRCCGCELGASMLSPVHVEKVLVCDGEMLLSARASAAVLPPMPAG